MASYLDKYRVGTPKWLVYYHKGEIKAKKGYVCSSGSFVLADKDTWLTTTPSQYMSVSSKGRVLVRNEEDIPTAKEMIRQYYISKISEIEHVAISQLSNIQKMLKAEGGMNG